MLQQLCIMTELQGTMQAMETLLKTIVNSASRSLLTARRVSAPAGEQREPAGRNICRPVAFRAENCLQKGFESLFLGGVVTQNPLLVKRWSETTNLLSK